MKTPKGGDIHAAECADAASSVHRKVADASPAVAGIAMGVHPEPQEKAMDAA